MMAPMSAGDKLMVREIVREVVQTPEMKAVLTDVAEKAAETVVARRMTNIKWLLVGAGVVGIAMGLLNAPLVVKLLLSL